MQLFIHQTMYYLCQLDWKKKYVLAKNHLTREPQLRKPKRRKDCHLSSVCRWLLNVILFPQLWMPLNQDETRKREACDEWHTTNVILEMLLPLLGKRPHMIWTRTNQGRKREAINNQSQRELELPVTLMLQSGTKESLQLSWIKPMDLTIGCALDYWVTTAQCEVK